MGGAGTPTITGHRGHPTHLQHHAALQLQRLQGNRATRRRIQQVQRQSEDATQNPDVQQATNKVKPSAYARLNAQQENVIVNYAPAIRDHILSWEEYRNTGRYDEYDPRAIDFYYEKMVKAFNSIPTKFVTTEGVQTYLISFRNHTYAQDRFHEILGRGRVQQFMREIRTFHGNVGQSMANATGLGEIPVYAHRYILVVEDAVSAGGGVGEFDLGAEEARLRLYYEGPNGTTWELELQSGSFSASAGGGVGAPIDINREQGSREKNLSVATAQTYRYYAPEYFEMASVQTSSVDVQAAGQTQTLVGEIYIGEVKFDSSGRSVTTGTDQISVGAGTDIGFGWVKSSGEAKQTNALQDIPMEPIQQNDTDYDWQPYLHAYIYFKTDEAELGPEDAASIADIVRRLEDHAQAYPNDTFKIQIQGMASRRYEEPKASEHVDKPSGNDAQDQLRANAYLADDRATVVQDALQEAIYGGSVRLKVLMGWSSMEKREPRVNQYSQDPNDPRERGCRLQVLYNVGRKGRIN